MTDDTIVAVYDTRGNAELAAQDLKALGIPDRAISMHAGDTNATSATAIEPPREHGFWSSLFGGEPDHDTTVYDRSVASGSIIVTVKVPEGYVARIIEILESYAPVDLDERAAGYGLTETATPAPQPLRPLAPGATQGGVAARGAAGSDPNVVQLAEERLTVGKRVVNRGGTRIRRFVVETPVEQQVTLLDEKVTLERNPVTGKRQVNDADFTDKTIEMAETREEAVVAKQAYVTEEITLRKQASERVETVRDTVRREDVEIKKIPGGMVSSATTDPVPPRTPKI